MAWEVMAAKESVFRLAAVVHGTDNYDHYLEMVQLR